MERKRINGFNNYYITRNGQVLNNKGRILRRVSFKGSVYVRLFKNGERHTLSLRKLLGEHFEAGYNKPELYKDELVFNYPDSKYLITSKCRVYNLKTGKWLTVFSKKGYPAVNISINGIVKSISLISFLKERGGYVA